MDATKLVITKLGEDPTPVEKPIAGMIPAPVPYPPKGGKSLKHTSFPKSILKKTFKIKGTKNPTKPPPIKKGKHTIRISLKNKHQKTMRRKVRKLKDQEVRNLVKKHNLSSTPDSTPVKELRSILEGGLSAGMISM